MPEPAKILLLDIETAPSLGWVWEKWQTNVIDIKEDWYILSFSVKWLNEPKIETYALPDFPSYKTKPESDKALCKVLWKFLDKADVIVAHNGDRFDLIKANARFLAHGLTPPSPYETVDTLKLAKTYFKLDSNRLNDIAKYLKIGSKLPHTGAQLWFRCMSGDKKAWQTMRLYNEQDVRLLEQVYLKLRPWAKRHPNLTFFTRKETNCPVCGSGDTKKSGYRYLRCSRKQRRTCNDCGHRYDLGRPVML